MGCVSKAGWALVCVGEAQSLAYICVLLFTNLIQQPFSPFKYATSSLVTLTLASPLSPPPPEHIGRPWPKHRRWWATPCWPYGLYLWICSAPLILLMLRRLPPLLTVGTLLLLCSIQNPDARPPPSTSHCRATCFVTSSAPSSSRFVSSHPGPPDPC
jgi:hypothetical protein